MLRKMKTYGFIAAAVIAAAASAFDAGAQSNSEYHLNGITIDRQNGLLKVGMTVSSRDYKLKYNQQIEVTPIVRSVEGNDSVVFPSFIIAGRNAYYNTLRSGHAPAVLLRSGKGDSFTYEVSAEWADWMEHCRVELLDQSTGCCGVATAPLRDEPVAELDYRTQEFAPQFHYVAPVSETVKMRRIEGKAYINFPVNRTEIYPDYMVNPVELRKITSSIDTVRFNPDATVKSITLTGFASPEGPYANNVRLAQGRTEALKEYVRGQYTFPSDVFHTDYVPEDWAGLRDSVAVSYLPDRNEILDFIDNGNVPVEVRNDRLMKRFPASYKFLLKNVYPSLRHTNYAIDYELKSFTDVDEIRRVMKERPQNLSLNEFYIAANSYPKGSPEADAVFELAATYFPNDDVANLNAANASMSQGDYKRARMLLERIPDSPEATYALGVLSALEGDYPAALEGMEKARKAGVAEAAGGIESVKSVIEKTESITFFPDFKDPEEPSAL